MGISRHRIGCEAKDGGLLGLRYLRSDALRGFEAIQLGHLHVHQDDVVRTLLGGSHGLFAIDRYICIKAEVAEQPESHLPVDGIVFGEKNAERGLGCGLARGGLGRADGWLRDRIGCQRIAVNETNQRVPEAGAVDWLWQHGIDPAGIGQCALERRQEEDFRAGVRVFA